MRGVGQTQGDRVVHKSWTEDFEKYLSPLRNSKNTVINMISPASIILEWSLGISRCLVESINNVKKIKWLS